MDLALILDEDLPAVSPQRMRIIVDGIIETFEKGLEKDGNTVVSALRFALLQAVLIVGLLLLSL